MQLKLNLKEEFLLINGDTWIDTGFSKIRSARSSSVAVVEVKILKDMEVFK